MACLNAVLRTLIWIHCNQPRRLRSNIDLPDAAKNYRPPRRACQRSVDFVTSTIYRVDDSVHGPCKVLLAQIGLQLLVSLDLISHGQQHVCFRCASAMTAVEQVIAKFFFRNYSAICVGDIHFAFTISTARVSPTRPTADNSCNRLAVGPYR